jgi:hypothetical protein
MFDNENAAPLCPNCGEPMKLERAVARPYGRYEIQIFQCDDCRVLFSTCASNGEARAAREAAHVKLTTEPPLRTP